MTAPSRRHGSSEILSVEGLSRSFGGFNAVTNLSFHVDEGEVLGLVGPNGAGKTTTFNLLTGFLKPSAGRITFRGEDVTGLLPHRLARRGMVRTFQHTRVFPQLSVRENVRVAAHLKERGGVVRTLFGSRGSEAEVFGRHVDAVLDTVGLADRQHSLPGGLPYGEQRVLEIALALAAAPTLLLLDEPFAGMNETESSATMDLVHAIRDAGTTVVVIDHHMQTMARGCDRLVVMDYGVKLAEGSPADVTSDPKVIQAYMGVGGDLQPAPGTGDSGRNFMKAEAGFCKGVRPRCLWRVIREGDPAGPGLPGPGGGAAAHFGEPFALLVDDRGGLQGLQAPAGQSADFLLEEVVGARPQVTGDLLQGEPQELERQYLLQRDEILVGVQAVPGPGAVGGAQEPLLVVKAQGAHGDARPAGELPGAVQRGRQRSPPFRRIV